MTAQATDILGRLVAYVVVVAVYCEVTGYEPTSAVLLVGMLVTVGISYGVQWYVSRRRA